MKKRYIVFTFTLTYLWLVMIHLGALVFETFIIYPNIFYNPPRSLETAMAFMVIRGPSDFFRPVGLLALLIGIGSVIVSWRVPSVRYWMLGSVIIILGGEFLLSVAYFWPRNTILFVEGAKIHSAAYLQQTAREFQTGHWLRLAMSVASSILAFIGFMKFNHHKITTQDTRHET